MDSDGDESGESGRTVLSDGTEKTQGTHGPNSPGKRSRRDSHGDIAVTVDEIRNDFYDRRGAMESHYMLPERCGRCLTIFLTLFSIVACLILIFMSDGLDRTIWLKNAVDTSNSESCPTETNEILLFDKG